MKLLTAIARFDTQLRADGRSQRTRQAYLRDLRKLRAWLGKDVPVTAVTPDALARFLAGGNGRQSALTVNRAKTALRVFFRFLTDAGYLRDNPARLIRSTPTDRRVPGYLSSDEAKRLLGAIPKSDGLIARRDHAMFSLLLGTGIWLGSLVALNAGDVNRARRIVTITAKGERQDTVFLNPQLTRLLSHHIEAAGAVDGTPLFCSRNGTRLGRRQVQLRLKYWVGAAGIAKPVSVHWLRHSFATRLYSQTGDLRLVQRALGHRHIATTEIYARVEDKALRRALAKLSF
ncbi:MAG: tyrosine-type recombinase/integrase [Candidatus Eisenbacteria bacterium]